MKGDTKRGGARCDSSGAFKNYVRENSLCVEGEVFDAKSRKIRRLADPEVDSDAVNKLHLDHRFKTISEDMDNRINYNRSSCEQSKRELISRIQNLAITEQNWKKDNRVYIQNKFATLQRSIDEVRALFNENISKTERKIAADNAEIKQMIDREIKELHIILKNNIMELYELVKTVPKSE